MSECHRLMRMDHHFIKISEWILQASFFQRICCLTISNFLNFCHFYSKAPFNEEINEIKMMDSNYCAVFDESSSFSENECLTNMMHFVQKENQNEFELRNFQFSPFHSDVESQINACENIKRSKIYFIFEKHPEKLEV